MEAHQTVHWERSTEWNRSLREFTGVIDKRSLEGSFERVIGRKLLEDSLIEVLHYRSKWTCIPE